MKKLIIMVSLCLWLFHLPAAYAPERKALIILKTERLNPYEQIWKAVCMEESRMDSLAYNPEDPHGGSHGISQIGVVRLNDYNSLTDSRYTVEDLYNPAISKKIFMYYAVRIGFRDYETIIRKWNGSGIQTYYYLKRVLKHLNSGV